MCWIASLEGIVVGAALAWLLLCLVRHLLGEMAAVVRAWRKVRQVLRQDTSPHLRIGRGVPGVLFVSRRRAGSRTPRAVERRRSRWRADRRR